MLRDLLEAVRGKVSAALVVFGEAGMGKTALLDFASSISELPQVRISGVEAEHSFGFAALQRLLIPFLQHIPDLPAPQRAALESAFGLVEEGPPDLFMVGLATLTLLALEASDVGLLCIVDDAQWIDAESLQSLAFVGRRISAEGIVLLFGFRTHLAIPPELATIPSLEVGGLPFDAAIDLLNQSADRPLAQGVAERVVNITNGCPLALWELGKELAESRTDELRLVDEPLTIGPRLEDHFLEQVSSLSEETQKFLLVAASETLGDRAVVLTASYELGCRAEAEIEAERLRLLVPGPHIRFRHPLIRSAIYARADPDQRRLVHRTLADAMGQTRNPDRWARHTALGADRPSEQLAAELEGTAELARARGGYSAQASLLVQAANLSESRTTRSVRLLEAASAAMNAGQHNYAVELLDQAEPHLSDPYSVAEAHQLRGQLSIRLSQPADAPALLLEAARLFVPLSVERARKVLLEAFEALTFSGHLTSGIVPSDIAATADETIAELKPTTLEDRLLIGTTRLVEGGGRIDEAINQFREAAKLLRSGVLTDEQMVGRATFGNAVTNQLFDDHTYHLWVERVDGYARRSGALLVLLFNLFAQMEDDVRRGDLAAAMARHAESLDVAAAVGLPSEYYEPMDVVVKAWAGEEEVTKSTANALIEVAAAIGVAVPVLMGYRSLAILHIGDGRYREAFEATEYLRKHPAIGWPALSLPLAVEAGVRSGERDKAKDALGELQVHAQASGSPWALGLLARSSALLAELTHTETLFRQSIDFLRQTRVKTDLAHTQRLYGEWLRRQNRQVDARNQLRAAHDFFVEMGATSFAKRSESELLIVGERVQPRAVRRGTDLTPQERRIAALAADRLTNPEIASQLFISPATVDYHLRKVYRKLGIESRRQLGDALIEHAH